MPNEKIYAEGLRTFAKHDKAPDFVLGTLIITPNDLFAWCKANEQYLTEYEGKKQLRLQMTRSDKGKVNITVDTWKPGEKAPAAKQEEDGQLPF